MEQNWLAFVYRGIVFPMCSSLHSSWQLHSINRQCINNVALLQSPTYDAVLHSSHQQSKCSRHFTRPGDSPPCDPADKGEVPKTELRSKTLPTTLRWPHRSWARSWVHEGYIFKLWPPASLELRKPSGEKGHLSRKTQTQVQLHIEIQDWKIQNLFPTIFETQNGVWRECAWKCSVIQVTKTGFTEVHTLLTIALGNLNQYIFCQAT